MGLFYSNNANHELVGYNDAWFLSNPNKGQSRTGYLFMCGNLAITWRSTKQTLVITSSNHAEYLQSMKPVVSVCGWDQWLNIFVEHLVYCPVEELQPYCVKTILHA